MSKIKIADTVIGLFTFLKLVIYTFCNGLCLFEDNYVLLRFVLVVH